MMKASQTSQKALAISKAESNFKDCNSLVDSVTGEYIWDTWMMLSKFRGVKAL